MTAPDRVALADILQAAVGDHILGLRFERPQDQTPAGAYTVPQFENRVWFQEIVGDNLAPLPSDLLAELTEGGKSTSLFVDTFLPGDRRSNRPLTIRTDGGIHRDSGAVIHHVVGGLPAGSSVAFLAPASITTAPRFEHLRAEIDESHGVAWLVYGGGRPLPAVHHLFQFVILVLVVGTGPADLTRLVDLRGVEPGQWVQEMRSARKRGGGEVGASIVLRDARLGHEAWTYERWTRALSDSMADSQKLGNLRPLGELLDSVVIGLNLARDAEALQPVGDDETPPDGFVPVIGGRDVRPDGISLPGRFWAHLDAVPGHAMVQEGDLLLRAIVSPSTSGPKLVGAIVPPGLEAALDHHVLRLRWKEDVAPQARELLTSWLLSERASRSLAAGGVGGFHIHADGLRKLQVPDPSESVVMALDALADLERWYRSRAEAVRTARQAVFAAERYGDAVPLLLDAQQSEGGRVTAAEDSQKFGYRVRNHFPHPIALRRERLLVLEHGKDRLEDTLECAEHLVHYLALCGLVQLTNLRPGEPLPSRHLQSTVGDRTLRFSWGSSWSVLKEAVDATRKLKDPLASPLPQLALLEDVVGDPASGPGRAEAELRLQRNNQGHLHRVPLPELVKKSERMGTALDELLGAVVPLADIPLVYVRDCALDGFTGERRVVFDLLQGSSVVFDRSVQTADRELPRDSLGLLGQGGVFYALSPWLLLHTCHVCKRPEVFVFNRCEPSAATFVAMETGHPWESQELSDLFRNILLPPTAG